MHYVPEVELFGQGFCHVVKHSADGTVRAVDVLYLRVDGKHLRDRFGRRSVNSLGAFSTILIVSLISIVPEANGTWGMGDLSSMPRDEPRGRRWKLKT